jgi:hypothetical protein
MTTQSQTSQEPAQGLALLSQTLLHAAVEEADEIKAAQFYSQREAVHTAERLADRAESLARHMTELAERLRRAESLDDLPVVNSLGEIQGRGLDIDLLCAMLAERLRFARELGAAIHHRQRREEEEAREAAMTPEEKAQRGTASRPAGFQGEGRRRSCKMNAPTATKNPPTPQERALDRFVAIVAEIRDTLEALQEANDEHYDHAPEEIHWGTRR